MSNVSSTVLLGRLLAAFGRLEVINRDIIGCAALAAHPHVRDSLPPVDERVKHPLVYGEEIWDEDEGVKHPLVAAFVAEVEDLRQKAMAGEAEVLPLFPYPGFDLGERGNRHYILSWALGVKWVPPRACVAAARGASGDEAVARADAAQLIKDTHPVYWVRYAHLYMEVGAAKRGFAALLDAEFGAQKGSSRRVRAARRRAFEATWG